MKIARKAVRVEFAWKLNLRGVASPKTPLKESLRRQLIQKSLASGLEHSNSPVLGFAFIW